MARRDRGQRGQVAALLVESWRLVVGRRFVVGRRLVVWPRLVFRPQWLILEPEWLVVVTAPLELVGERGQQLVLEPQSGLVVQWQLRLQQPPQPFPLVRVDAWAS